MTRTISAAWAAYATWRNPFYKEHFQELIADPGTPCSLDIFTPFWHKRQIFEVSILDPFSPLSVSLKKNKNLSDDNDSEQIVDATFSITGLILFCCLSWSLLKVGACPKHRQSLLTPNMSSSITNNPSNVLAPQSMLCASTRYVWSCSMNYKKA